jgi:hypothetical protein
VKKKALIIGASPLPFEGPWVRIDDNEAWRIVPDHDYGNEVAVELLDPNVSPNRLIVVNGDDLVIYKTCEGLQARARVLGQVLNVPHVSIWLEAVNGSL